MKMLYKLNVAAASASMLVLMAAGSAGAVSGRDGGSGSGSTTESSETTSVATSTDSTTETETTSTGDSMTRTGDTNNEMTQSAKDAKKLEHKVKLCLKHEGIVKKTASRIADRAQKHLDLFTTIATRTETFYTNKGKTLPNYSALVDDVNAKKVTAQAAVDVLVAEAPNVNCDDAGVISASAATFRADAKKAIGALKEYKTAVKSLIVGVKSVQSVSHDTTDSSDSSTTEGSN